MSKGLQIPFQFATSEAPARHSGISGSSGGLGGARRSARFHEKLSRRSLLGAASRFFFGRLRRRYGKGLSVSIFFFSDEEKTPP